MMSKKNMVLLALLAAQIALIAFVYWPEQESQEPGGHFFADLKVEQIKKITITDDEQKTMTLAREGETWVVGAERFPANQGSVRALLAKIVKLESNRLITTSKSSYRRLKVAEDTFARRLELELEDGSQPVVYLGSAPSQKTIYVRMAEAKGVYLVNDFSSWEVQAGQDSWWRNQFVEVGAAEIKAISLTNSRGAFTIQRGNDGWHFKEGEEKVAPGAAEELLATLSRLTYARYLPASEGKTPTAPQVARVQLELASGPLELQIWGKEKDDKGGELLVKASDSAFYAKMRESLLGSLLAKSRQDLVELAPPPPSAPAEENPEPSR